MPWVGLHAQQVRTGVCRRGTTTRQGARALGPIGPDTLAKPMVQGDVRPLEAVCHRAMRALGQAGVCGQQVTGMADGTDGATTARDAGCGRATRTRRIADTRGQGHESAVTVYGWQVLRWMEAAPKMPLAVQGGQIQARAPPWTRALVTQARAHGAGAARLATVVVAQGCGEGSARWWLDQPGIRCVVPAKANLAVTADARAQAAAGERLPVGERVHPVRHGPGQGARTARLETEVVGITGLTTDDQEGTVEPGRDASRRDVAANPLNAVVVRPWHGRDDGPEGNTVFRTHAAVDTPWLPCDDDDERRLSDNCGMQAAKQPWDLGQPPQKTARAVRVPVLFTLLLVAWATASRWPCEREAVGGEPVGWQRWRRQLLEHTRDQVMVLAQGYDGSFHRAD
jgi:hypothetical protein